MTSIVACVTQEEQEISASGGIEDDQLGHQG